MRQLRHAERYAGFTVLELLIVIVLMAILTVFAVPNLRTALQNNRVTAQTNDVITAFQLARSEAVKRGQPVTVCASDVLGGGATPTCGNDWNLGWMAVVDGPASEGANAVTIAERIRVWTPTSDEVVMTAPANGDFVRFLPRGNVDDGVGLTLPATFGVNIVGCVGERARDIEISRSGAVGSERVTCS